MYFRHLQKASLKKQSITISNWLNKLIWVCESVCVNSPKLKIPKEQTHTDHNKTEVVLQYLYFFFGK